MRPHTEYPDSFLLLKNLINQPVLNIYSAGQKAFQVTHKCFIGRWVSVWIFGYYIQQTSCVFFKTRLL